MRDLLAPAGQVRDLSWLLVCTADCRRRPHSKPLTPGRRLSSDFRRSDFDRFVSFGFVPEPTQASLSCIIAPGAALALDVGSLPASEEVFSESKARALFFIPNKSLHIRRLYDAKHRVLVYVSYSTRISAGEDPESKGQYKTGTCAIPLP